MNDRRKAIKAREVERMLRSALEVNRLRFGRTLRRVKKQRDEARAALARWPEAVEEERAKWNQFSVGNVVHSVLDEITRNATRKDNPHERDPGVDDHMRSQTELQAETPLDPSRGRRGGGNLPGEADGDSA